MDKKRINLEIQILKNIFHFNIIKIYQVIETINTFCIIMEYYEGGELFDYIINKDHLSENESRCIFHQIIDAIDYMHQMGISHRDLKPENILLNSNYDKIKIIDFGLSNLYFVKSSNNNGTDNDNNNEDELLRTPCGSPGYAPPEMVLGFKYNGLQTDIWSSGIILYAMLCGSFPFDDDSEQELYSKIVKGKFDYPDDIILSREVKNLIEKILVVNPHYRATIDIIKNDPWFKVDYNPSYGLFYQIQEIPVDMNIIKEMEKYGLKKEKIIKDIKENKHNEITTFYYLMVKKFNRYGIKSVSDFNSSLYVNYIKEQNEKIKNNENYKNEINLKLLLQKNEIKNQLKKFKGFKNGQENQKERNIKSNNILAIDNKKEIKNLENIERNSINHVNTNIFSYDNIILKKNKKEPNSIKNNQKSSQIDDEDSSSIKILIKKNQNNKNRTKNIKKEDYKTHIENLKLNNYMKIENKKSKDVNNRINLKKGISFNLNYPINSNDIRNTLILSSKEEKVKVNSNQTNPSFNTDRIIYINDESPKQNNKIKIIKKGNMNLFTKLDIKKIKDIHLNKKQKIKHEFIHKIINSTKTPMIKSYNTFRKNNEKKGINFGMNNKNNYFRNRLIKNKNLQKEKEKEKANLSYNHKEKYLFDNITSKILNISERRANSNSQTKYNKEYKAFFNSSNLYNIPKKNNNNKNSNKIILQDNNSYYKRKKNTNIRDSNKIINDLKIISNRYKDNRNINLNLSINLNLNEINGHKESMSTFRAKKNREIIKKIKNNKTEIVEKTSKNKTNNKAHLNTAHINSYSKILKNKIDIFYNNKNNANVKKEKHLLNSMTVNSNNIRKKNKSSKKSYSKERHRLINFEIFQNSYQNPPLQFKIFSHNLSRLLPYLKSVNSLNQLKKGKAASSYNNLIKKSFTIINQSNSNIMNNTNENIIQKINNIKKISKIRPINKIKNKNKIQSNIQNKKDISYNSELPINSISIENLSIRNNHSKKKSPQYKHYKLLNLKGTINNKKNFLEKPKTVRGEESRSKILEEIQNEITKKEKSKISNRNYYLIKKISKYKNEIREEEMVNIAPLKIKEILIKNLPKNDFSICHKIAKSNYFVFHCVKGLMKIIIELMRIKENNYVYVSIKYISGNKKDFINIKKQIWDIINNKKV